MKEYIFMILQKYLIITQIGEGDHLYVGEGGHLKKKNLYTLKDI